MKATVHSTTYPLFLGWLEICQEIVKSISIFDKKEEPQEEWNYLLQLMSL